MPGWHVERPLVRTGTFVESGTLARHNPCYLDRHHAYTRRPSWVTILLGIVGAIFGGFLGRLVGWYGPGDPVGFVMAVLGAIALLIAYRLIARRTRQA